MCGIVGYIGTQQAAPLLIEGLTRLEHRGYDSAGLAVLGSSGVRVAHGETTLNVSPSLANSRANPRAAAQSIDARRPRLALDRRGRDPHDHAHPRLSRA